MLPTDFPKHLFLVGCGNMAGAMLARWIDQGLEAERVTVLRPSGKPVAPGVRVVTVAPETLADGTVVVLGVKPQMLGTVAPEITGIVGQSVAVLSLLAGVPAAQLSAALGGFPRVVRSMPNTPVAIGLGVTALYAPDAVSADVRRQIGALIAPLGLVEWFVDEGQFNLLTALSGSGPAYVFRIIDALARAAADLGMESAQAQRIALAMVHGAASLAAASEEAPGVLADRVASPGGTTREGMNVLDADERLVTLMTDVLRAARDRGDELARLAGG